MISLHSFFIKNLGLKIIALVSAILIWSIVTGRERTSYEKTLRIPVEITNPPLNIEVKSISPEEVQVSVQGRAQLLNTLDSRNLTVRVDLSNSNESAKLQFFAEDHIEKPEGLTILSIHPKMLEIQIEELISRTVPIQLTSRGRLPSPYRQEDLRVNPAKTTIYGYRSEIEKLKAVSTEEIDLSILEPGEIKTIPLRQSPEILKFIDSREVEIQLVSREKGNNGRR